jgi:putative PIN family toxin of toxin-antitoxin system
VNGSVPPSAVLDTNVLVSGVLSPRGAPGRILEAFRAGAFVLVTSAYILDEFVDVLARPKLRRLAGRLTATEIAAARAAIASRSRVVRGDLKLAGVLRDPKDHPVLACAIEGQADYLVTGDKRDLLPLGRFGGVIIIAPSVFVRAVLQGE